MAAKSTASFFSSLQEFEKELATRAKELRYVAERERPENLRRSTRLIWLDELASLQEVLTTQAEFSRSAVQLDTLIGFAEVAADSLEAALTRAEDVAAEKYGFEQPVMVTSKTPKKTPKMDPRPSMTSSNSSGRRKSRSTVSPDLSATIQTKTPKNSHQRRRARPSPGTRLSDPPTPNMDDLGLSSAALHLLKGI